MNTSSSKQSLISISLAIFSMLFGAGNLIYPLAVGRDSGNLLAFGTFGFLLTTIFLPLAGLVSMILFDGNYKAFFNRLGKRTGNFIILICMMIIGPVIAIPRVITLSHTMLAPFLPIAYLQTITIGSSFIFCVLFLGMTYLATFRKKKIVDLLGKYIGPALLIALIVIIYKGIQTGDVMTTPLLSAHSLFTYGFMLGYQTLDLLGMIFFASIIITILKQTTPDKENIHKLALLGLKAGIIGVSLLGIIYAGMSIVGAFHGHGLEHIDAGNLFKTISFALLGQYGAAIISVSVFMACFSTAMAVGAVVAEYIQHSLFNDTINFRTALIITLTACIPLSTFGLKYVLQLTGGPITFIGYPVLIAITFCNIAYKTCNFTPIKLPVFITFFIALTSYFISA